MFSVRSNYSWYRQDDVICIEDLCGDKSVTNDMENILKEIAPECVIDGATIIYKDSEGTWDGVRFKNGVVTFYSINKTNLSEALAAIRGKKAAA